MPEPVLKLFLISLRKIGGCLLVGSLLQHFGATRCEVRVGCRYATRNDGDGHCHGVSSGEQNMVKFVFGGAHFCASWAGGDGGGWTAKAEPIRSQPKISFVSLQIPGAA